MDHRGLARQGGQGGVPTQEGSSLRPLERPANWSPGESTGVAHPNALSMSKSRRSRIM